MSKKLRLFIDGGPLVHDHFSGVGHSLLGLVRALDDLVVEDKDLSVIIFVPTMLKNRLNNWNLQWVDFRGIPYLEE